MKERLKPQGYKLPINGIVHVVESVVNTGICVIDATNEVALMNKYYAFMKKVEMGYCTILSMQTGIIQPTENYSPKHYIHIIYEGYLEEPENEN